MTKPIACIGARILPTLSKRRTLSERSRPGPRLPAGPASSQSRLFTWGEKRFSRIGAEQELPTD
jgi:hypothetical protein